MVVVGGGLAGITAAIALAEAKIPVTVLEARPWLGGATWSFIRRGLTIDNGQHAFPRCFTSYRALLARLGVTGSIRIQDRLDLTAFTGDRQLRLRRSGWPAPLHLGRVAAGYRTLSMVERLGVVQAAMTMWLSDVSGRSDGSMADWLGRHRQDEHARRELWDMFLVPILNAAVEQADVGTAADVISAMLLSGRDQADLGVPTVPLRDLHGVPAVALLARLGAEVRVNAPVISIKCERGGRYRVQVGPAPGAAQQTQLPLGLDDPDVISAVGVVLAVPPWFAAPLVPAELSALTARWDAFEPSPVVSLHVMYNSRVTRLPFAVSTGSAMRWITDRSQAAGLQSGQYLAAAIPAAGGYVDMPAGKLRELFLPEIERLFPAAGDARVDDFFVTRERRATFMPVPGSRLMRPDQATRLGSFALAGAWTSTGWPDTMEGAVRSGMLAAESVMEALRTGGFHSVRIIRQRPADVPVAVPDADVAQYDVPAAPERELAVAGAQTAGGARSGAGERAEDDEPAVRVVDSPISTARPGARHPAVGSPAGTSPAAASPASASPNAAAPVIAVSVARDARYPAGRRQVRTGSGTRQAATMAAKADAAQQPSTDHAEAAAGP